MSSTAEVTICVLTYGDYPVLARQCVNSILALCPREKFRLVVGANAVCPETQQYLESLQQHGLIDELHVSSRNINKCPMMRRMLRFVSTRYIWWFDDDSWVFDPQALNRRLEIAAAADTAGNGTAEDADGNVEDADGTADATTNGVPDGATVLWGHMFFYGNERDFNYGTDVAAFVRSRPWFRGLEPPSWEKGDGRWFFITGGNWFIRTSAIRQLDWPDLSLVKRNDDVLLCEAIRQQGWNFRDIGPLGVTINSAPRRGEGEDRQTMVVQMGGGQWGQVNGGAGHGQLDGAASQVDGGAGQGQVDGGAQVGGGVFRGERGCVFVPTFRDGHLLEENFGGRPGIARDIDFVVVDDNYDEEETEKVKVFCAANGWTYRHSGRERHGSWREHFHDGAGYNRFIYSVFMALADHYDYVIKMDTDAYIVSPDFFLEMEGLLCGSTAAAGTLEHRRSSDVRSFWELKGVEPYSFRPNEFVPHLQGGIYGVSRSALMRLRELGFLEGVHDGFSEDGYMSYCCLLLGIPLLEAHSTGSWWHPYRPDMQKIRHLKAVHPMMRKKWEEELFAFS